MTFLISWDVTTDGWEYAAAIAEEEGPKSDYDRHKMPLYHMLVGAVQFQYNGHLLFPPELILELREQGRTIAMEQGDPWYPLADVTQITGWGLSIVDLAYRLVTIRNELCFGDASQEARYQEEDGTTRIDFRRSDEMIHITSGFDIELSVPLSEFCVGVRDFLADFSTAVFRRLPELQAWETFVRFRQFLPSDDAAD